MERGTINAETRRRRDAKVKRKKQFRTRCSNFDEGWNLSEEMRWREGREGEEGQWCLWICACELNFCVEALIERVREISEKTHGVKYTDANYEGGSDDGGRE